jgi:hypothetical protein
MQLSHHAGPKCGLNPTLNSIEQRLCELCIDRRCGREPGCGRIAHRAVSNRFFRPSCHKCESQLVLILVAGGISRDAEASRRLL